tara:strand:- start:8069 stop:8239 length:171 start_codon:yes stop_codon:yes gene_type:complete
MYDRIDQINVKLDRANRRIDRLEKCVFSVGTGFVVTLGLISINLAIGGIFAKGWLP